jgi:hypothetical protein
MIIGTRLETFRGEVETAIRVFYAYEAMSKLLSEQKYVNLANNNADFWIIFLSSAQTKLFIALGRLYDDSNDAFSFRSFIKICRENIEEFGRQSFEKRRLSDYVNRPDWLDGYLSDAYFGKVEDIDGLARLARPFNKKMKGLYKEIRSKVFAHAIHTDKVVISNLFEGTNFEEIDDALKALWSIYSQIWQLYNNARQPTFKIESYPYRDDVVNCIRTALTGGV